MNQESINYAKVLYELGIEDEAVKEVEEAIKTVPELKSVFCNPTVSMEKKQNLVDKISRPELAKFLKVVLKQQNADLLDEIFTCFEQYSHQKKQILDATLIYQTPPNESEVAGIKAYLTKKYEMNDVKLKLVEDKRLLGGFIIRVGNTEYDQSYLGQLNKLKHTLIGR